MENNNIVKTTELNTYLGSQISFLKSNNHFKATNSFLLLKKTGIRAGEINLKYWVKIDANLFKLTPTKRNNPRFFTAEQLTREWIKAIETQNAIDFCNSYSSLMYYFQLSKQWQKMYVNEKEICNHLYRHLYARAKKQAGESDNEIREDMGEKNQSSADKYIYGTIYINL